MAPPSLRERYRFYRSFDARAAFSWARSITSTPIFAINPGYSTRIVHPRLRHLLDRNVRTIWLRNVRSPEDLHRRVLKYLPEGVYYWRNVVSDPTLCERCPIKFIRRRNLCANCPNFLGQELMFDIDPERLPSSDFSHLKRTVADLYDALSERFSDLRIVFSGRGFHIHVLDPDAFLLSPFERMHLMEEFREYGVDVPVTAGGVSLARLPYTLNGRSGFVVTPVNREELEEFDPYHSSS